MEIDHKSHMTEETFSGLLRWAIFPHQELRTLRNDLPIPVRKLIGLPVLYEHSFPENSV